MKGRATQIIPLLYAILLLMGGLMGYIKAQSIASLSAALAFGLPLLIFSWKDKKFLSMAILALLLLFFSYRFIVTTLFMPAGLMAVISLLALSGMAICQRSFRAIGE